MKITGLVALLSVALLLVTACGPGGSGASTASPSTRPTPTPIASPVATLDEAARIVIASDPRFAGVTRLDPNVIGASAWWVGRATETDSEITITIGWGDCPAGCINKHIWLYTVSPDGTLTLDSESGDPMPPGSQPA